MTKEELPEILSRAATGEEAAFRSIFDFFRPNIYTTALRITNNEWMAEDIVQDTFIKVWIRRAELPNIENVEGWIYVVARNATFSMLKKAEHYKAFAQEEAKDALLRFYPEADYQLQDKEFQQILQLALDRLPDKQRQAYHLIKELQLKRDEAAKELQVSPETVKSNLELAMKSIRAYCMANLKDVPIVLLLHFFSKYF